MEPLTKVEDQIVNLWVNKYFNAKNTTTKKGILAQMKQLTSIKIRLAVYDDLILKLTDLNRSLEDFYGES
jgi:uncharacterized protein HemX